MGPVVFWGSSRSEFGKQSAIEMRLWQRHNPPKAESGSPSSRLELGCLWENEQGSVGAH